MISNNSKYYMIHSNQNWIVPFEKRLRKLLFVFVYYQLTSITESSEIESEIYLLISFVENINFKSNFLSVLCHLKFEWMQKSTIAIFQNGPSQFWYNGSCGNYIHKNNNNNNSNNHSNNILIPTIIKKVNNSGNCNSEKSTVLRNMLK